MRFIRRFRRLLALAMLGVLAIGAVPAAAAAAPASAAPEMEIIKIGYNAAGPDRLTNAWQEYVDLRNTSGGLLNIKGWFLQDQWAHAKNGNTAKPSDCNTAIFTKEAFPHLDTDADDDGVEDGLWLPKGHHIRVYTAGAPDNSNNDWHTMAINKPSCGYNGHFWNNLEDTARLKRANGTLVTTWPYSFKQGYWVARPSS